MEMTSSRFLFLVILLVIAANGFVASADDVITVEGVEVVVVRERRSDELPGGKVLDGVVMVGVPGYSSIVPGHGFPQNTQHFSILPGSNGVKLSAAAASFNVAASSSESGSETKMKISIACKTNFQPNLMTNCSESSSNPSWHVEDLMDTSSHYGFCKIYDQISLFTNEEFEGNFDAFASKDYTPAQEQSLTEVSEKNKVVKCSGSKWCEEGSFRIESD